MVTEDVIINLLKQHIEMFSGRPILYDKNGCSKHYSFKKSFSSSYLENAKKSNEMKSDQQLNYVMKSNQQGRQSKSPFKTFLGMNYYSKY